MGKIYGLVLKIFLGFFAAANFVAGIVTTDLRTIVILNVLVAIVCLCIYLFIESRFSGLATDLGISRAEARQLICNYFNHYKNVEKISVYEYHEKLSAGRRGNS